MTRDFQNHQRSSLASCLLAAAMAPAVPALAGNDPVPGDNSCLCFAISEGTFFGNTSDNTGIDWSSCGYNDTIDEWYCYSPAFTGTATISTCGPATGFDTTLTLYTQKIGCGKLNQMACNDNYCGLQSQVEVGVVQGANLYIRVSGVAGATGSYQLNVSNSPGDHCDSCLPIAEGVYLGSTDNNTGTADDTPCASGDMIDEWYCYTASTSGIARVSTCSSNEYFDTTLAAFFACGGGLIACSDDACGLQSQIQFPVVEGDVYYIRVSGDNGATGNYVLDIDLGLAAAFFESPVTFQDAVSQAGLAIVAGEGFEEAVLPPQQLASIDDPLDAGTNNGVFSPGDIPDQLTFQSNLDAPGTSGPNPSGASGLAVVGPAALPVPDIAVVSNFANDSFDIIPTGPVSALELEVLSLVEDSMIEVRVFDTGEQLIGEHAVFANDSGTFVAFTTQGAGDVGRINLYSSDGGFAGVSDVTVYGFCPGDTNGDLAVDVTDLVLVILEWGSCGAGCPADLDANGLVDVEDLVLVVLNWGSCG